MHYKLVAKINLIARLDLFRILLANQRFMDMRDDTTASDRCLDQTVQLLVSADGQLQMPGGDTLHLQVLGRVSGQLQDLQNRGNKVGA